MDARQERCLASSFSSSVDRYFGGSLSVPGLTQPLMQSPRDDLGTPYWRAAHLVLNPSETTTLTALSI